MTDQPATPEPGVVLLLGGRSEIGLATTVRLAAGRPVVLAVRPGGDPDQLAESVRACERAGASSVAVVDLDADDAAGHAAFVAAVEQAHGPIAVALLAFGVLGDQERAEVDPVEVARVVTTDFVAQASLLTALTVPMLARNAGQLVAFSSVAGVRVRRANYVYGSAKAGLDGFCAGLTDRLHGTGVRLLTARPGFVIGRMTAGMKPAVFSRTAEQVADVVAAEVRRGRHGVVWIPYQLRLMFAVARLVPRAIWRRMPR